MLFSYIVPFRQHWSLLKDVEIVMVNGLAPWGNTHFIPRGPMREPLTALGRADIVVIHNADMVCCNREIAISILLWFTAYFYNITDCNCHSLGHN